MNTISQWHRRLAALMILSCAAASGAWAQSAASLSLTGPVSGLRVNVLGDSLAVGAALGVELGSHFLEAAKPTPSVSGLSSANIPGFDRLLYTTTRSNPLSYGSDATVAALALLPGVLIPGMDRKDLVAVGVVYAESLGLSFAAKDMVKALVVRYRPYAYSGNVTASQLSGTEIEDSFPSGHVTVAFAAAVTGGIIFDRFDAKTLDRWLYWGSAMGLATGTAVLRVASGNHFVSDVVAGAALGSLIGFLVPYLHMSAPTTVADGAIPLAQWSFRW